MALLFYLCRRSVSSEAMFTVDGLREALVVLDNAQYTTPAARLAAAHEFIRGRNAQFPASGYFDVIEELQATAGESFLIGSHGRRVFQQPSATPSYAPLVQVNPVVTGTPTVGGVLSVVEGSASGSPAPTVQLQWQQNGVNIGGATGRTYTPTSADAGTSITVQATWTNTAGTARASSQAVVVVAPVQTLDYNTRALAYYVKGSSITGSNTDVTEVPLAGTGGLKLTALGSGASVTNSPSDGLGFTGGKYLGITGLTGLPITDGVFVVAKVTLTAAATGTLDIFSGNGKYPRILSLSPGSTLIVQAVADSNTNTVAGSLSYPMTLVVGGEMDDVANTLRVLGLNGSLSTSTIALTDPQLTAINIMRNGRGTLERLAIVGRPEGGDWPMAFESVVADFRAA